jgi:hypothetical protein
MVLNRHNESKEEEKTRRKLIVGFLVVGVSFLVAGGSAVAYYSLSATGSGSTHATLVTPTPTTVGVTVTVTCPGLTTVEPGVSQTCTFAIKDFQPQEAVIRHIYADLYTTSVACPATWFTYNSEPYDTSTPPIYLASGGTYTGTFTVTFKNLGITQDACWGQRVTVQVYLNS